MGNKASAWGIGIVTAIMGLWILGAAGWTTAGWFLMMVGLGISYMMFSPTGNTRIGWALSVGLITILGIGAFTGPYWAVELILNRHQPALSERRQPELSVTERADMVSILRELRTTATTGHEQVRHLTTGRPVTITATDGVTATGCRTFHYEVPGRGGVRDRVEVCDGEKLTTVRPTEPR